MMSLPRGPGERKDVRYAGSRLGVTVWSAFFLGGSGHGALGHWRACCSRIIERSALCGIALVRHCLAQLDLSGCTDICTWSDVCRRFRALSFLSTACRSMTEETGGRSIILSYGIGAHFKNPCDGHLRRFRQGKR